MRGSIGGYIGRILHVNLSSLQHRVEEFSPREARAYIGGSGFAAKRLWEMTHKESEPLGPENVLIFMTGPLTGTKVPLSGRHEVVAKSPLTTSLLFPRCSTSTTATAPGMSLEYRERRSCRNWGFHSLSPDATGHLDEFPID